jgi:hypothetical protein
MEPDWSGVEWNRSDSEGEWKRSDSEGECRLNTACLNTFGGVGDGCAWRAWNGSYHRL